MHELPRITNLSRVHACKKIDLKMSSAKSWPFCFDSSMFTSFPVVLSSYAITFINSLQPTWRRVACSWNLPAPFPRMSFNHYGDFIMGAMASQITRLTMLTSKLCVTGLCEGNSPVTEEFPAQRVSNVKNVSIWWRHRDDFTKTSLATHNGRMGTMPQNIKFSLFLHDRPWKLLWMK